ncbi:hypothetical protein T265_10003 [Opisthorchis viverrini]|uniref:Uncharacterized protein n=1 Tax=Opisthorchis viverrini TaxID=6198 RepID=A0A074Z3V8_OPIVI|nr:hypothetical protein T265_10003 [Opisthorchis viverrini]KER21766.1 hypothetical protein T265_10003 [Opisthorchis viverrini]
MSVDKLNTSNSQVMDNMRTSDILMHPEDNGGPEDAGASELVLQRPLFTIGQNYQNITIFKEIYTLANQQTGRQRPCQRRSSERPESRRHASQSANRTTTTVPAQIE